jgi:hypothetical protein
MADDLEIDLERMSLWTEKMARFYFENGGSEPEPDAEALADAQRLVFKARLEKEGMAELWEPLDKHKQTLSSLVELIRNDRPKFLPALKEYGIAKLPDRQRLRDLINAVANPPVGSEDQLREEYKDELATYPWCLVVSERVGDAARGHHVVTPFPVLVCGRNQRSSS